MTTPRTRNTVVVTYLFTAVMVGTTLPTPLYAIYTARLSLTPLLVTVIYAVYAVGVLGTLLTLGRLSDHVGRRPVVVGAVAFSAASAVVFLTTSDLPGLFAGRLLSGVSAGLITGAATAYLTELERDRPGGSRAPVLSTLANMGGLGLGPILAGVLAEHLTHPTVVPYLVGLTLLVPVVALVALRVPETVADRDGWQAGLERQRLGVPPEIRSRFLAPAVAGLASFALLGFTTALSGQLLSGGLHDHSHQTAGAVASLLFLAAVIAQILAGRLPVLHAELAGLVLLAAGAGVIVTAVLASSLALLILGVLVGGFGVGLAFRAGLQAVAALAPPERRGEVTSTFFTVVYVGLTVPVVIAGILITTTTLLTATVALALFVALLALGSGVVIVRTREGATV